MESTQRRMIAVAALVCGFAVGMAGLLNYFKYRSTANNNVEQRLVFTGKSIENSIQASLSLGLQFSDLGTLPALLERERATDDLILSIDVFDTEGKLLYSTDRLRAARPVPAHWIATATKAGDKDWTARGAEEPAVGISIQNNFGLTIGHLALRYAEDRVRQTEHAVAGQMALTSLAVLAVAATLASLAMVAVMRGLSRDVAAVDKALASGDPARAVAATRHSPFRGAVRSFVETVRAAEAKLAEVRAQLQRGAGA